MVEKVGDETKSKTIEEEEFEANIAGSEEMELSISLILEKIENGSWKLEGEVTKN